MTADYVRENWYWRDASIEPGRAVIFDIDGVLADAAGRQHYLDWGDWKSFFDACGDDPVIEEIERLLELGTTIKDTALCGLGQTAPNPVLSTLRYFRGEYEAHLQGRCPAGRCPALVKYVVTDACVGCTRCAQICPVQAIPFTPYVAHAIDDAKCTRCDACRPVCPAVAIEVRS